MADTIVPKEALAYLKAKDLKPGFDYRDVWKEEHSNAFTVAKMMHLDLLADTQGALVKALEEGQTFKQFREHLKPMLVKKGWWGQQLMNDPLTSETKLVQLGSDARLKTIYKTNMRTARVAGQWSRIQRTKKAMPYLLYQLGPSFEHRLDHEKLKDLMLPVDDPFWLVHYPPNGWGCKCWVRQVSEYEAKQLIASGNAYTQAPEIMEKEWVNKRTGAVELVPEGIDPGWNYNPGNRLAQQANNLMSKAVTASPRAASIAVNDVMSQQAISGEVGKVFAHAVDDAIEQIQAGSAKPRGTTWHLGALPKEAIEQLEQANVSPVSAVISIRDADLFHMLRDNKGKRKGGDKRLPQSFIESLPQSLVHPKAILRDLQQKTPSLLYVYDLDDKSGKLSIKMDYEIKLDGEKVKTNLIRSGEIIKDIATLKSRMFEVIYGELD